MIKYLVFLVLFLMPQILLAIPTSSSQSNSLIFIGRNYIPVNDHKKLYQKGEGHDHSGVNVELVKNNNTIKNKVSIIPGSRAALEVSSSLNTGKEKNVRDIRAKKFLKNAKKITIQVRKDFYKAKEFAENGKIKKVREQQQIIKRAYTKIKKIKKGIDNKEFLTYKKTKETISKIMTEVKYISRKIDEIIKDTSASRLPKGSVNQGEENNIALKKLVKDKTFGVDKEGRKYAFMWPNTLKEHISDLLNQCDLSYRYYYASGKKGRSYPLSTAVLKKNKFHSFSLKNRGELPNRIHVEINIKNLTSDKMSLPPVFDWVIGSKSTQPSKKFNRYCQAIGTLYEN